MSEWWDFIIGCVGGMVLVALTFVPLFWQARTDWDAKRCPKNSICGTLATFTGKR